MTRLLWDLVFRQKTQSKARNQKPFFVCRASTQWREKKQRRSCRNTLHLLVNMFHPKCITHLGSVVGAGLEVVASGDELILHIALWKRESFHNHHENQQNRFSRREFSKKLIKIQICWGAERAETQDETSLLHTGDKWKCLTDSWIIGQYRCKRDGEKKKSRLSHQ